ncbi:MAG: T9SS type A sorting domain-containing protein [Ignavibacteriaceae bacterium]
MDSITIKSPDATLQIQSNNDSIYFCANQSGQFRFKGIGWKDGQHIEVSPLYYFTTGPTFIPEKDNVADGFIIFQNYPNPFNNSTTFEFILEKSSYVKMGVFDVNGRLVTWILSKKLRSGHYRIPWNNRNLSSGIYYLQMEADKQIKTKTITIIK